MGLPDDLKREIVNAGLAGDMAIAAAELRELAGVLEQVAKVFAGRGLAAAPARPPGKAPRRESPGATAGTEPGRKAGRKSRLRDTLAEELVKREQTVAELAATLDRNPGVVRICLKEHPDLFEPVPGSGRRNQRWRMAAG